MQMGWLDLLRSRVICTHTSFHLAIAFLSFLHETREVDWGKGGRKYGIGGGSGAPKDRGEVRHWRQMTVRGLSPPVVARGLGRIEVN